MYYNNKTFVFADGRFVRAKDASFSPFSQTLHYGYGVFEGLRSYDTQHGVRVFRPVPHFDRMRRAATLLGLECKYSNAELEQVAGELLERNQLKNAYIRPVLLAGDAMALQANPHTKLFMAAWRWPKLLGDKLLHVGVSTVARPQPSAFPYEGKVVGFYVNSIMASTEARRRGYDEAILLDHQGHVAQSPGANLFIEKNGTLVTPPLGCVMPGITRQAMLELAAELDLAVEERLFGPRELQEADAAMLVGTATEVAGIGLVDGVALRAPYAKSNCARLAEAYNELVHSVNEPAYTVI
jgi:branched-chain amino acid aminotransferase